MIFHYKYHFVFLVLFFPASSEGPDSLSAGGGAHLKGLPPPPLSFQSITTKATKHASVNISVASATGPGVLLLAVRPPE